MTYGRGVALFEAMSARLRPDSPVARKVFPSPNHGERRAPVSALILHYTGMPTGEAALKLLCDPIAEVSAHYFVWENGMILQLVPESRRAWHAGKSSWAGETDLNSASIGVEIVNPGHDGGCPPFPDAQMDAVAKLAADVCRRHRIRPERVLAHSDIAPGRKRDPGETFPWERLHRDGIGHWVAPAPVEAGPRFEPGALGPPVTALQTMLAAYGYGLDQTGVYDERTRIVVEAFQRHFRPERVDGIADLSTLRTLRALIDALPQAMA